MGIRTRGEEKPKRMEGETRENHIRRGRREDARRYGMGSGYLSVLVWAFLCWALAPAGRPSALIALDRSISIQSHHSGCSQGSWHGRTIL
jgi:hypothetical protein